MFSTITIMDSATLWNHESPNQMPFFFYRLLGCFSHGVSLQQDRVTTSVLFPSLLGAEALCFLRDPRETVKAVQWDGSQKTEKAPPLNFGPTSINSTPGMSRYKRQRRHYQPFQCTNHRPVQRDIRILTDAAHLTLKKTESAKLKLKNFFLLWLLQYLSNLIRNGHLIHLSSPYRSTPS